MIVKTRGGDYLGLYRDLMAAKGLDEARLGEILAAHGVTEAALADSGAQARTGGIAHRRGRVGQHDRGG